MDLILLATSLQPDRSIEFTLTVIIAGLGIVLATLAILIVIFYIFGNVISASQKNAKERKTKKLNEKIQKDAMSYDHPVIKSDDLPEPSALQGVPSEVVAAISAAVYMLEGEGAVVTSIKRKSTTVSARSSWAQAAVIDNTRPF